MELEPPRLIALHVGKPRTVNRNGKAWTSAIHKAAVAERLFLDWTNLTGDRQANLRYHGGPHKAVCCFAAEHYPFWRAELELGEAFAYGAFGENFTLQGMTEERVCIGDVFAVGSARVQVSQPRQPCVNLVHRWGCADLPERMMDLGRTGYYLRVLQTGEVGVGDAPELLERPYPDFSIAAANRARYHREGGNERAAQFASLPELAPEWKRAFQRLLRKE